MLKLLPIPLILMLAACGDAPLDPKTSESAPATPVQTAPAISEEWPALYEAAGTVRARTTAVISARLMSSVVEVGARAGDHVRAGQVLVSLDARDLDVAARRIDAAREEVRAGIPEADSSVASAKASLDLAQITFKRMQELYAKKSITDQELDVASAALKAAQAAADMARARRTQLDSKLAQVEQEARAAAVTRSYAEITAPFAGIVTARSVEPGALAVPGAPLLTVERDGGYRLEATIEESRLPSIRAGQPVTVTLGGVDKPIETRVSEIVPAVDPASRTYLVKIDLPATASIRSGMFGRALFQLGRRAVLAIPAQAVAERGQMQSVMVAADGIARTRLISTGQNDHDRVEILSGLQPGETVIAPIPQGLADGDRIEAHR